MSASHTASALLAELHCPRAPGVVAALRAVHETMEQVLTIIEAREQGNQQGNQQGKKRLRSLEPRFPAKIRLCPEWLFKEVFLFTGRGSDLMFAVESGDERISMISTYNKAKGQLPPSEEG